MRTGGTVCSAILSNTFVYCLLLLCEHAPRCSRLCSWCSRRVHTAPARNLALILRCFCFFYYFASAAFCFFLLLFCAANNKNCFITKLSHISVYFTTRRPSFPNTLLDENALTSVRLQSCLAVSVSQGTEDFLLGADRRQNLQRTQHIHLLRLHLI